MRRTLRRLFLDHPREVGESYFHHQRQAFGFGFKLLRLSGTAFLHGLMPGVHKTTVSDEICATAQALNHRAKEARDTRMKDAGVWDPGL
ncbi:MAG: hypothetical protein HZY74_04095 [Brevundimonas sp.]|nr:MAG: hypothetical protein HZY74_04095 [Brevundimonas sp.]